MKNALIVLALAVLPASAQINPLLSNMMLQEANMTTNAAVAGAVGSYKTWRAGLKTTTAAADYASQREALLEKAHTAIAAAPNRPGLLPATAAGLAKAGTLSYDSQVKTLDAQYPYPVKAVVPVPVVVPPVKTLGAQMDAAGAAAIVDIDGYIATQFSRPIPVTPKVNAPLLMARPLTLIRPNPALSAGFHKEILATVAEAKSSGATSAAFTATMAKLKTKEQKDVNDAYAAAAAALNAK